MGTLNLINVNFKSHFYIFFHDYLQISEKSCNFVLFLLNLYCIKRGFMKEKNCIKLLYRLTSLGYVRFNGKEHVSITQDFPCLSSIPFPKVRSIEFATNKFGLTLPAKAWKDKHENVIIRVYNYINQLEIDYV